MTCQEVSSYYWDPLRRSSVAKGLAKKFLPNNHEWAVGNFGDLLTRDILNYFYPEATTTTGSAGHRILVAGSIGEQVQKGDILAGIGFKRFPKNPLTFPNFTLWGIRGPLSLKIALEIGGDASNLCFVGDPGLLASKIWPQTEARRNSTWAVIPHFRHLRKISALAKKVACLEVISPDDHPKNVAMKIRNSAGVISSSLHGIIFAHSYGVPAIALRPPHLHETIKYSDYAQSVSWSMTFASTIGEAISLRDASLAPDVSKVIETIKLPPLSYLRDAGVAR